MVKKARSNLWLATKGCGTLHSFAWSRRALTILCFHPPPYSHGTRVFVTPFPLVVWHKNHTIVCCSMASNINFAYFTLFAQNCKLVDISLRSFLTNAFKISLPTQLMPFVTRRGCSLTAYHRSLICNVQCGWVATHPHHGVRTCCNKQRTSH
jgi:hypothetical protein